MEVEKNEGWELVKPPQTLEDFEEVRASILNLMGNLYCDQFMFLSLTKKLTNVDIEIEKLKNKQI